MRSMLGDQRQLPLLTTKSSSPLKASGSYVGSLAKFKNRQTLSMEPFSSKSDLKKRAVSMLTWKWSSGQRGSQP